MDQKDWRSAGVRYRVHRSQAFSFAKGYDEFTALDNTHGRVETTPDLGSSAGRRHVLAMST
jgi:hypothetical protein